MVARLKSWSEGNVVAIPLDCGNYGFGVVVNAPLVAFFDRKASRAEMPADLSKAKVAFSVPVMKYAIGKDHWSVVGAMSLPEHVERDPWFFIKDSISGKYSLYRHPEQVAATREECLGLECAAVWEPEHIESRLSDFFAGKENHWERSLAP